MSDDKDSNPTVAVDVNRRTAQWAVALLIATPVVGYLLGPIRKKAVTIPGSTWGNCRNFPWARRGWPAS